MQILAKTFAVVAALLSVSTAQIFTMCESSIREANTDHVRMAGEMQLCLSNPDPGQLTGCQCNLLGGMVEVCQRFLGSCDDEALTHVWTHMRDMHQDHIQQLGCGNEAPVAQRLRHSPASSGMGGIFNQGLHASTAKVPALRASNSSSVATRIVTDARPLVDTVQAWNLPSSNATVPSSKMIQPSITAATVSAGSDRGLIEGFRGFAFGPDWGLTEGFRGFAFGPDWLISTQQGTGGIAMMLLMVLALIAVTVAFLARRRQAPSEVEIADIGRP